jgi:hypothetical protein
MVEAPLYKIENIQHDSRIPFSRPGGGGSNPLSPTNCFTHVSGRSFNRLQFCKSSKLSDAFYAQLAAERELMVIPADAAESAKLNKHYVNASLGDITVNHAGAATIFDFGEWRRRTWRHVRRRPARWNVRDRAVRQR